MQEIGVDLMRISPQPNHTGEIIQRYHQVINAEVADTDIKQYLNAPACDGYWCGESGMDSIAVGE